jgi:hypothetical protein
MNAMDFHQKNLVGQRELQSNEPPRLCLRGIRGLTFTGVWFLARTEVSSVKNAPIDVRGEGIGTPAEYSGNMTGAAVCDGGSGGQGGAELHSGFVVALSSSQFQAPGFNAYRGILTG